ARLVRPKDPKAAAGFTTAACLIASIVTFLFINPFTSRSFAGSGGYVQDLMPEALEKWRRGDPSVAEYAEDIGKQVARLRQSLPPEKRELNYDGWESDVARLSWHADWFDRIQSQSIGSTVTMATVAWLFLSLGLLSSQVHTLVRTGKRGFVGDLGRYA